MALEGRAVRRWPTPTAILRVVADHLTGHNPGYTVASAIVWEIRLPRVLLAAVVGAALTTAGTVVQVLVRNALADPFLLGVSSGASVGATAVLLLGAFASLGVWAISVGSVLGALAAMGAVFLVSRTGRALALRRNLFIVTSLMAGTAVAVSGVIGFVGLVIPHIVRLMVGSDHRRVLPVGVLFGAAFMVLGDLLARVIVAPQEMPIGVITAFIGAPVLIVLIRRRPYQYGASE
jgi:ABC-type Fe3+-siderophore transport system permease subunit